MTATPISLPPPKSILVVNISRIGDTLLATPAIRAIAAAYPDAAIDILGHPNRVEVLQHLPYARQIGAITKKSAAFRGWANVVTGRQYDLAFVFGFDAPLVAYALRVAQRVIAYRQPDSRLNARLFKAVESPPFQSAHAVQLALTLPKSINIAPAGLRLDYVVTEAEKAWADTTLACDIPGGAKPIIGLQVASFPTKAYRDWPIGHFMKLCDQIRARWPDTHFLIFGGSEEKERTDAFKKYLGSAATLYAGQLTLRQTGALMSKLDLYVGVDTGPTHLMSTFDIPLVALYHGYSRSELIGPLEHPCCFAIDHPLAGPNCPIDAAMADITFEQVFAKVEQAMASRQCASPS
jgi:heptosyltransferase III